MPIYWQAFQIMNYETYISLRSEGKICAGIRDSDALRVGQYLPKKYQGAVGCWNIVTVLSIPAAIALMIFYKWWLGLIVLLVVPVIIFKANKKSAVNFVLKHAEEDQEFFDFLVENDLLIFRE